MRITPVFASQMDVVGSDGKKIELPLKSGWSRQSLHAGLTGQR